jgi:hypothetical protein
MPYYKAYDADRSCQYLGENLSYEYFISNEGNFASHDGASYEAYFKPVNYRGFKAFVENEAPDSGEVFVWVGLEDYISMKDSQAIITIASMMKLVRENPLLDFLYVYDLAAGATDFFADSRGLNFVDALGNSVRLLDTDDYEFYVDGLSIRVAPVDKQIMYAAKYKEQPKEEEYE